MADVFLSYSRRDADFAARIAHRLQEAGIVVWQDRAELVPGDSWQDNIEQGLKQATGVLLLLSSASVNSAWVTREYQYALSKDAPKPLYVALVEPIPPEEIPYVLRTFHYVDLTQDFDKNIEELIRAIRSQRVESQGKRQLYQVQAESENADQIITLQTNINDSNIDEVLEQVKKSLDSGARTIKVVNVDEE